MPKKKTKEVKAPVTIESLEADIAKASEDVRVANQKVEDARRAYNDFAIAEREQRMVEAGLK